MQLATQQKAKECNSQPKKRKKEVKLALAQIIVAGVQALVSVMNHCDSPTAVQLYEATYVEQVTATRK